MHPAGDSLQDEGLVAGDVNLAAARLQRVKGLASVRHSQPCLDLEERCFHAHQADT